MSTPYSITITMSPADVQMLSGQGVSLCALKAVQSSATGNPVVWYSTPHYSTNTQLSWSESYSVYSSQTFASGSSNPSLSVTDTEATNLGQPWQITDPNSGLLSAGVGTVPVNAVGIKANESNSWVVGMSQAVQGSTPSTMCAFTLVAHFEVIIEPIEKVLLYFDTQLVNTGTVITQAFSDGLLIDLTQNNSQTVNYTVANAWAGNLGAQFTQVPAENIVSTMINVNQGLQGVAARRAKA